LVSGAGLIFRQVGGSTLDGTYAKELTNLKSIHPSLVAVLAALLLLSGLAFFVLHLVLPGDASYPRVNFYELKYGGLVVQPLSPGPQSLQNGDVVMAIDGRSLDQYIQGLFSTQVSDGPATRLDYSVLRGGQTLQLDVPLAAFPLALVMQANWSIFLFIIYLELVSLLVFVLRPRLPAAQLFLLTSSFLFSSALVYYLGLEVGDLRFRWLVILYVWGAVAAYGFALAALVHLMLVFPKRHPILERHPGWVRWIYLGVWLLTILFLMARWASVISPVARLALLVQSTTLMSVVYLPLLLLSTYSNYRTGNTLEKRQLRWIVWSLVITLVPFLLLSLFPSLVGLPFRLSEPLLGVLLWAVPTSFAIAVLRERVFDIDLIINRTLVYVPLTGILAGLYSASVILFQKLFIASTGQKSDAAIVLSTLVLASAFTPFKNSLQNLVDKRFKEPIDTLKELKTFRKQVESVAEVIDTRRVIRRLLDMAMSAFHATCGAIYLERDGELVLAYAAGGWKEGCGILHFPMEQEGVRLGVLILGDRNDQKSYTSEDRNTLQQAVDSVADMIWLNQVGTPAHLG